MPSHDDLLNTIAQALDCAHGCWVTDRPDVHPEVTYQLDTSKASAAVAQLRTAAEQRVQTVVSNARANADRTSRAYQATIADVEDQLGQCRATVAGAARRNHQLERALQRLVEHVSNPAGPHKETLAEAREAALDALRHGQPPVLS